MGLHLLDVDERQELKDMGITAELFDSCLPLVKEYNRGEYIGLQWSIPNLVKNADAWWPDSDLTLEQVKSILIYAALACLDEKDLEFLRGYLEKMKNSI